MWCIPSFPDVYFGFVAPLSPSTNIRRPSRVHCHVGLCGVHVYRALAIASTREREDKEKTPAGPQMHNSWPGPCWAWQASWMKCAARLHSFIEGSHSADGRKWWCQRSRLLWPEREVSATREQGLSRIPSNAENALCQHTGSSEGETSPIQQAGFPERNQKPRRPLEAHFTPFKENNPVK